MVLTADHGSIPDPKVTGAFQISTTAMQDGINETFDTDGDATKIVQLIQPTQIFVNQAELRQNGHSLEDVARYVMSLTRGQTALPTVTVPADQANEKVFQAAFPSRLMQRLPCLPEARG
jgi:agmatine/peptidylarginine deiminase